MNPWIILGIVLFVAWAVLWLMFRIATGLIHLLVIIAIAMFIWGLVKRGARAVNRRVYKPQGAGGSCSAGLSPTPVVQRACRFP